MDAPDSPKYKFSEQLTWLENLSGDELKQWLRNFFWTNDFYPLFIPHITDPVSQLSDLIDSGSPSLTTRLRAIIPELIKEWGRHDAAKVLENLLWLCGKQRCADAETPISQIISTRLSLRPVAEAASLRLAGLGVLAGFGCSDQTSYLFERYIKEADCTATCFRALYQYQIANAARFLPDLLETYDEAIPPSATKLRMILALMLDYLATPSQRTAHWTRILLETSVNEPMPILKKLSELGIEFQPPEPREDERYIPVTYDVNKGWGSLEPNMIEITKLNAGFEEKHGTQSDKHYFTLTRNLLNLHQSQAKAANY